MCHASYTTVTQGDSWLLIVGNQIDIFIHGLYFNHNFYFKYSNGSYALILDI
jgi:hypothetical protein